MDKWKKSEERGRVEDCKSGSVATNKRDDFSLMFVHGEKDLPNNIWRLSCQTKSHCLLIFLQYENLRENNSLIIYGLTIIPINKQTKK